LGVFRPFSKLHFHERESASDLLEQPRKNLEARRRNEREPDCSHRPATLAHFVADLGPGAIAGTREQAAECDVVILAVHCVKVREALKGIDWRGRILVDATKAHIDPRPDISLAGVARSRAALKESTSSEIVADMAVGARLVKSISNMPMAWIQDFSPNPIPSSSHPATTPKPNS